MKYKRSLIAAFAVTAMLVPAATASAQIPTSSASPGSASGSAINLPGLLTLGQSSTTSTSSKVTLLSLAGLELLSKSGDSGQINGGLLGPVGGLLTTLNGALCKAGPTANGFCVVVAFSNTTGASNQNGTAQNASYATLGIVLGQDGVFLLGSNAASVVDTTGEGGPTCTDLGGGYIFVTKRPIPSVPPIPGITSVSSSLGQPCPQG